MNIPTKKPLLHWIADLGIIKRDLNVKRKSNFLCFFVYPYAKKLLDHFFLYKSFLKGNGHFFVHIVCRPKCRRVSDKRSGMFSPLPGLFQRPHPYRSPSGQCEAGRSVARSEPVEGPNLSRESKVPSPLGVKGGISQRCQNLDLIPSLLSAHQREQNRHNLDGETDKSSIYGRLNQTQFPHFIRSILPYVDLEANYVVIQRMKNFKNNHTKGTKHTKSEFGSIGHESSSITILCQLSTYRRTIPG